MQNFLVFQSLWAMERRHTDGFEPSLEANVEKIQLAGFDGVSAFLLDSVAARRTSGLLRQAGLRAEGVCFPKTLDDLLPALEMATEMGVQHLNVQADARPRRLQDAVALIEGWLRVAEEADFPVYFETHRNRVTTDLHFTLDLLDCQPDLRLIGDLSHFLVGREFDFPVSDENHRQIESILDRCEAFHGRVASREQIQVEISFTHHKRWLDLFLGWWRFGFASWMRRNGPDATLAFTCELGPKPYAISGSDGNDLSDRWAEALMLRSMVRNLWQEVALAEPPKNSVGRMT